MTSQSSKKASSGASPTTKQRFVPNSGKSSVSSRSGNLRVDEHRQGLVVDDDELGGIDPEKALLGDDRNDRLADVADDARGEHRRGEGRVCRPIWRKEF